MIISITAGVIAVISYLIGSISSAVIISKIISGKDIRQQGSGNAGATNMLRTYGKKMGVLTLLCDVLKGIVAILIAMFISWMFSKIMGTSEQIVSELYTNPMIWGYPITNTELYYIFPSYKFIAAFFVVLGHNYPIFFGFKGGKGVATSLGVVMMLNWKIGLIVLVFALIIMILTRYVSLGSISAGILYIAVDLSYMIFTNQFFIPEMIFCILIAGLLIFRHKENIQRLKNGTENKLGQKKKQV